MRNLKKLLAVIVSICVLATFAVPAFAETKTDAQIVTDLGMVQGTTGGVTAEYLATTPTRYQAAIMLLRLKGLEDEATAFIPTDNFSDLQGLNETNKAIVGYLKANPALGFEGIGNNKFDPLKPITAKEYYKVMLTVLGYKENTDFTWANVLPFAASKGLFALIENTKFTVNDLATATVEALKATVKGGTMTLLGALVESGAITADKANATGFFTATPKAFEVVSATADNLKVAKFVFSKEVNGDTVKADNFTVDGDKVYDAKLLDDKKTVLVIMNDGVVTEQNKNIDIKVKNVKDTTGTAIAEVTKTVTFIDTVIPTISGAVAKNAKTIVISASEPMNVEDQYTTVFDDIKVDDSAVTANATIDYAKNTVTLHLVTALAKGTHKIVIAKVKDFAGYVAVDQTYNFDIPEDTTAPAIASAVMKSNTSIEVTFNEDVDYLSIGSYEVNDVAVSSAEQNADDWSKVKLTLASALNIGATVEIKVEYKGQKDVMDNEVKDWKTYTFKVADDTTLPTVSGSINSSNEVKLSFSKAMSTDVGKINLYDKDDKVLASYDLSNGYGTDVLEWNSDKTELTLKPGTDVQNYNGIAAKGAIDVKVNLKDMKDASVRMNLLPETNMTIKCNDKEKPTVKASFTVDAKGSDVKDDLITFYFSEAMDADSAKNLSNYVVASATIADTEYVNGRTFQTIPDVSFSSISGDGKQITIKAKDVASTAIKSALVVRVTSLKDKAGNYLSNDNQLVSIIPATVLDGTDATVKATSKNTIEVLYNTGASYEDIGSVAPGAFIVCNADDTKFANVISTSIDKVSDANDDKLLVKLTIGGDMGTTATSGSNATPLNKMKLKLVNPDLIKDVYGTKSDATKINSYMAIDDGIKPTITTEVKGSKLVIKFSETVSTTTAMLIAELTMTNKDNARVDLTDATKYSFAYFTDKDGHDAAATVGATITCQRVEITLEANKVYNVMYNSASGAGTQDAFTNKVDNMAMKQFTTGIN